MRSLPYIVTFLLGALIMHAIKSDEISDLKVDAECNYHEGYNEGYRDGVDEDSAHSVIDPKLVVRDNPDGSQEITIDKTTPQKVAKTVSQAPHNTAR